MWRVAMVTWLMTVMLMGTTALAYSQPEPTPKCANPQMIWPTCTPRGNSFSTPGSVGGKGGPQYGGGLLGGLIGGIL